MDENDVNGYLSKTQCCINMTDILITDSEHSKQDIIRKLKVKKEPIVIYCAPISSEKRETENKYGQYFLYNGGFDPRKGLEQLVSNFLQLKFRGLLSSKLILTGKIESISFKLAKMISYGEQRHWILDFGYVPDDELFGLFINAKALVYPSFYEGFGLPPLEAMNLGCPVITTHLSSIPEICGDAVYYINREDERGFQEGLLNLEKNENLRRELRMKGLKQAQKYSWGNSADRFLEVLEDSIRGANGQN